MNRIQTVFQSESHECGLACLIMIQQGLGGETRLNDFRERVGARNQALTIKELVDCAKKLDLAGRPIQCELSELPQLILPAILHWRLNHWVVLTKATAGQFIIHDPAEGQLSLVRSEVSRMYTGIAIEFSRLPTIRGAPETEIRPIRIRDVLSKTNLKKIPVGLLFLAMGLYYVFALTLPLFLKLVVDEVLVRQDHDLLLTLACGFTLLGASAQFIYWLQGKLALNLALQMQFDLSKAIFDRLLRLPPHYFQNRNPANLLSRLSSIRPIQQFLSQGLIKMVINTTMLALCLIVISNLVPLAGIILGVSLAALLMLYGLILPRLKRAGEMALIKNTAFQCEAMDSFQNIASIQRYQVESFATLKLEEKQETALTAENRSAGIELGLGTAQGLMLHLSHVVLIYALCHQVMSGRISLGTCYLILSYRHFVAESVKGLSYDLLGILSLRLHLERISDFYIYEPDEPVTHPANIEAGHLILRDLRVTRHQQQIAYPFKLEVRPGQLLVIQGPSGCGKSTLIEAIAGLLPISSGTLSLGSQSRAAGTHKWSPQQVGSVLDTDRLHSGSIASNIRMHQPGENQDRLIAAAVTAQLHGDILALPLGYDTVISTSNVPLSLGQIQRLLIARALYHDPRLLLLDESTANLDPDLERQLIANLRRSGRTLVVATHRNNLIQQADIVLTKTKTDWQLEVANTR